MEILKILVTVLILAAFLGGWFLIGKPREPKTFEGQMADSLLQIIILILLWSN